jgi:hypothetical protein
MLKNKGEVPFPVAGEGVFLRFTLTDIGELEQIYGIGEYLRTIDSNISEGSGSTLLKCLEIGLKRRDDAGKMLRVNMDPDDISFPVVEAHEPVMDALCLSVSNLTYRETLEEIAKRQAEIEAQFKEASEDSDNPLPVTGA